MMVNNEIGVKQPIAEIGQICRANKIFLHTDAAQAVGKIPVDVDKMNIDLMSISGHKIYAPKGKDHRHTGKCLKRYCKGQNVWNGIVRDKMSETVL